MIINRLSKAEMATKVFDLCTQVRNKAVDKATANGPVYLMDGAKKVGKMYPFAVLPSGESQAVEMLNKKGDISAIVRVYSDGRYVVQDKPALKSNRSVLKNAKELLTNVLKSGEQAETTATITSYMPGTPEYTEMLKSFGVEPGYYDRAMAAYKKCMPKQGKNVNAGELVDTPYGIRAKRPQ